ncbi:MAG: hypothetical protein ABSA79_11690, partial [Candidatus Bathyarchaeia archaeon]
HKHKNVNLRNPKQTLSFFVHYGSSCFFSSGLDFSAGCGSTRLYASPPVSLRLLASPTVIDGFFAQSLYFVFWIAFLV